MSIIQKLLETPGLTILVAIVILGILLLLFHVATKNLPQENVKEEITSRIKSSVGININVIIPFIIFLMSIIIFTLFVLNRKKFIEGVEI